MSASRREVLLGTLAAVLLAVLLPWLIQRVAGQSDLHVDLPQQRFTPTTGVWFQGGDAELRVGPPGLRARLGRPAAISDRQGNGPALTIWRVVYGSRWTREVQLPTFPGSTLDRGAPGPCAFGLVLRPGLLDDGEPGGGDLASQIETRIAGLFPITVSGPVRVEFPKARDVRVSLRLESGVLDAQAQVFLADGTRFRVSARFELRADRGQLVPRPKSVRLLEWSGPSRDSLGGWVGGLARALIGERGFDELVQSHAEPVLRQQIAAQLGSLRLPGPRAWFPGRPDDKIGVRLCGRPRLLPDGIYLPLALDIDLRPWRDPRAPGSRPTPGPVPWPTTVSADARIEMVASAAGVAQLLELAWQARQIPELDRESAPVKQIRRELAGRLDFELRRIELTLPPALDLSPPKPTLGSWPVRVMGVQLGALSDGRQVVSHLDVALEPRVDGDGVTLAGRFSRLHWSCVASSPGGGTRLSPCLSDVLPIARERLEGSSREWPLGSELVQRLSTTSLGGYTLTLQSLRGGAARTGVGLHLSAGAQLQPTGRAR